MKKYYKIALEKRNIDIAIAILAYTLVSYLNWSTLSSVFFVLFVWFILNPIKAEIALKISILSLAVTPFLLLVNRKPNAETLAQISFFFLVISAMSLLKSKKNKT